MPTPARKRPPKITLHARLVKLGACSEALDWMGRRGPESAWVECEQADWMLWIAARVGVDRKLLVLAACDCAETALRFVPAGEDRPRLAIETARAWARDESTIEDVRGSRRGSRRAAAAAAAAYAASAAAARGLALRRCADLVRARIPWQTVNVALEAS